MGRVEQATALLAGVAFIVAVVAAGVMQSDGTTTAAAHTATLIADVGHTLAAKTARVTITITSNTPTPHQAVATGVEDFAHDAVDIRFGTVEERLVGGVRYIRPAGQKWVATPVAASAPPVTRTLDAVRFAKSVHVSGQPRLDGIDTTEYTATIDLLAAGGSTPNSAAAIAALPPAVRQLVAGLQATPVHVWIDGSHHIRRFMVALSLGGAKETIDLRYANFGLKTSITAPPADQLAPAGTPVPSAGAGSFFGSTAAVFSL